MPRFSTNVGARAHAEATGQGGTAFDWGWSMSRHGEGLVFPAIDLAQDELITVSILAGGDAVGEPTPEMGLLIDNVEVGHWQVTSLPTTPVIYTVQIPLTAGQHAVAVTFPNGADQPADNIFNSLVVGYLDLTSAATVVPPGRALVYTCEPAQAPVPEDCYRSILTGFAAPAQADATKKCPVQSVPSVTACNACACRRSARAISTPTSCFASRIAAATIVSCASSAPAGRISHPSIHPVPWWRSRHT